MIHVQNRPTGLIALFLLAALVLATSAAAEVRRMESVGVVPVNPRTRSSAPLRDRAIQVALREGVTQIARELLASEPGSSGTPPDGADANPPTGDSDTDRAEALHETLGDNPVDYTTRFRILEDRGEQPALFAANGKFATEYQVVVEVHVDVDRVRSQLIGGGMLLPEVSLPESSGIRMEIRGIDSYPGYRALQGLLLDRLGISAVTPVEFTRESILVELTAEDSDFDLLARLVQEGPPAFDIQPLPSDDAVMKLAVKWDPGAEAAADDSAPWASDGGDFDDPGWREAQDAERKRGTPGGVPATREW
jgi:hypothetical protein